MKKSILITILCFSLFLSNAQDYAIVQGVGAPYFKKIINHDDIELQEIIDHPSTNDGDTLYLPGAEFTLNNNVVIDKRLVILGTGIHPDSAYVEGAAGTTIRRDSGGYRNIIYNSGSSGSAIYGVSFIGLTTIKTGSDNTHSDVHDILIKQCHFDNGIDLGGFSGSNPNPHDITVSNCFIGLELGNPTPVAIETRYSTNLYITNNIMRGAISFPTLSDTIVHNLFINTSVIAQNNSAQAHFANNFVLADDPSIVIGYYNDHYYYNNVWILPSGGTLDFSPNSYQQLNNTIGSSPTQVFVSPPATDNLTEFSYDANYHLNSSDPFIYSLYDNEATDGTEIGIYGGEFPWIDGTLPFIPHWQELTIEGVSNGQVGVTVGAMSQPTQE